jgi:replicative DNA helicase
MDKNASIHTIPPQNLEAEESLLSAVLLDNSTQYDVLERLFPEDF